MMDHSPFFTLYIWPANRIIRRITPAFAVYIQQIRPAASSVGGRPPGLPQRFGLSRSRRGGWHAKDCRWFMRSRATKPHLFRRDILRAGRLAFTDHDRLGDTVMDRPTIGMNEILQKSEAALCNGNPVPQRALDGTPQGYVLVSQRHDPQPHQEFTRRPSAE